MDYENEKIKTKTKAEITNSDTKMYTVSVKVTEKKTKEPVTKGKVVLTTKKGKKVVGTGKIKNGTTDIVVSISSKDYKLRVNYEGTEHTYAPSETKIDFKSEYLFYKTSFYIWTAIVGVLIVLVYIIGLNTIMISSNPQSLVSLLGSHFLPYVNMNSSVVTEYYLENAHYLSFLIKILVWVLIISFVAAGIYAVQFNSNLHNIIRKNVTNHSLFQNFVSIMVIILIAITALVLVI
ncbi:hypothetical protein [Methanosphaera sp.]